MGELGKPKACSWALALPSPQGGEGFELARWPVSPPRFKLAGQGRGSYAYEGPDAVIVLNEDGQVVTAWAKNHDGWRHQ
jgi:hypothetical protein